MRTKLCFVKRSSASVISKYVNANEHFSPSLTISMQPFLRLSVPILFFIFYFIFSLKEIAIVDLGWFSRSTVVSVPGDENSGMRARGNSLLRGPQHRERRHIWLGVSAARVRVSATRDINAEGWRVSFSLGDRPLAGQSAAAGWNR